VGVSLLLSLSHTTKDQASSIDDLTEVLDRRSPIMEHLGCYEQRLTAYLVANQNLSNYILSIGEGFLGGTPLTPEQRARLTELQDLRNEAAQDLAHATEYGSPNPCPSLPLPKGTS